MKILVTGGAGFIGSHLVNRLVELGHEVKALDNLSSGKKENINKKANLIIGDIRDESHVRKSMRGCGVVFHLAALTSVRNSNADDNFRINYLGARNVFTKADSLGAKIIFSSSAAVYGNTKLPTKEDAECDPISDYGRNKLKAEKFLAGKDAFIARLFNVYGPGGKSVINRFCLNVKQGNHIRIFGSGLQTRDYIHVNDVVDALIFGLENKGTYNIATGEETSVLSVIDMVEKASGQKPETKFEIPIKGDVKRSRADITMIKNLGWKPEINIENGINDVWSSL
jgi:UDP-glucose 4-epimerase